MMHSHIKIKNIPPPLENIICVALNMFELEVLFKFVQEIFLYSLCEDFIC